MNNIHTLVCIDEDEFENFKKFQNNFNSLNKNNIDDINKEIEKEINLKLEKVEKRQIEQQVYIYDLNGEIRKNEVQIQKKIKEQDEKLNFLRQEYLQIFKNEKQNYLDIFLNYSQKIINIIDNFEKNIQTTDLTINYSNDKKKDKVLSLIKDLQLFINSLVNLPHDRFYPNQFEYAESLLADSIEDFNSGFFESSFITAKNCYKVLSNLKEQTLIKEKEYIYLESTLKKNLKYLSKLISQQIKIADQKLNIQTENILKINRWIKNLNNSFDANYNFNIQEIKHLINVSEKYINQYQSDLKKIFMLVINSQIRFNIAEYLNNIFCLFFYKLINSGYIDNDFKKSYFIVMANNLSDQLIIYLDPDKKNLYNYKIRVESDNNDIDLKLIKNLLKEFKLVQDNIFDHLQNKKNI